MKKKGIALYYFLLILIAIACIITTIMADGLKQYGEYRFENKTDIKEGGDTITYSGLIPGDADENMCLEFYTSHETVSVLIGGEEVYSVYPAENSFVKTTGYRWNIINLKENYQGKDFVIVLENVYGSSPMKIKLYYGQRDEVFHAILRHDALKFFTTLGIFFAGIFLLMYAVITEKKRFASCPTFYLGTFAIILTLWTLSDTNITALLLDAPNGLVAITHCALMVLGIPFMLFLQSTFVNKESILWNVYIYCCSIVCILRLALQMLGIADFKETLYLTHITIVLLVPIALYLMIMDILRHKLTKAFKVNMISIAIILLSALTDLLYFKIVGSTGAFGLSGFLLYVVTMGSISVEKSQKDKMKARETEVYRKLAYVDELTGMYNRMAFHRDMENRFVLSADTDKKEPVPTGICMVDLNALKTCNDNFGHDYGDQYIRMVAKQLVDDVGSDGCCYRIGGDEFCVILDTGDYAEVSDVVARFRESLNELDNQDFVVTVSAAVGAAVFEADKDATLMDTMKRADKIMYENKLEMKKSL